MDGVNGGHKGGFGGFILIAIFLMGIMGCGAGDNLAETLTASTGHESGRTNIQGMQLGDVQFLDFGSGQTTQINFAADSGKATYLALIQSQNVKAGNFSLTVQGSGSVPAASVEETELALTAAFIDEPTDDNPMHEMMRAWGSVYADDPEATPVQFSMSSLAALSAQPKVGDTRSFRVLDSLQTVTSYDAVTGRLRYITDDVLLFVDTEMDGNIVLNDAWLKELADGFNDHSLPLARDYFGNESDINGDGRITILMTPVLNRICAGNGIVTGFFFPGDLFEQNAGNPASNEEEIFYTMVPDPDGAFCNPIGAQFVMENILPGVLVHELQHMISFNQHVFESGGTTEEAWLNEGLSHLIEDLAGYGLENYSRMSLYLNNAANAQLIPSGLPTLAERGMSYMFLRYLYEQSSNPSTFLRNVVATNKTGIDNLVAAFNGKASDFDEFSEFFANWQVAVVLTGTGITDNPRYIYEDRTINPVTGNISGVCMNCSADDGRGTVLSTPNFTLVKSFPTSLQLVSSGGQFFELEEPGQDITVSGSYGAQLGGALIRLEDAE